MKEKYWTCNVVHKKTATGFIRSNLKMKFNMFVEWEYFFFWKLYAAIEAQIPSRYYTFRKIPAHSLKKNYILYYFSHKLFLIKMNEKFPASRFTLIYDVFFLIIKMAVAKSN